MEMVLQEGEEWAKEKTGVLPWMFLNVLLVEPDDSTRQIVAALLRKCSYKVTAVSDGLKAWEALKEKPNNIDLVLTEVELLSVSGFSLLIMIMGHETCKNIPVIMMSPHDSISMVFKCMLKGAADFLVKPLRKNELRNLWQHVWRRQSSIGGGHGHQDKNIAQQKFQDIPGNNAASNHFSDNLASMQKNMECSEKGSDAHSTCTKPDMEAESAYMQNRQERSQKKCRSSSLLLDSEVQNCEKRAKLDATLLLHENEGEDKSVIDGLEVTPCSQEIHSPKLILEEDHTCGISDYNHKLVEPCKDVIDLIGAIDNRPQYSYEQSEYTAVQDVSSGIKILSNAKNMMSEFTSMPQLELSLRRYENGGHQNQEIDERHTLNHSSASAFSLYNKQTVHPGFPTSTNFSINSEEFVGNSQSDNASDIPHTNGMTANKYQGDTNSLVIGPTSQTESVYLCPPLGISSVPLPTRGINFDSLHTGCGVFLEPMFYRGPQPWNADSVSEQEAANQANISHPSDFETHKSERSCHSQDQMANMPKHQADPIHEQNLETPSDQMHLSSASGQSRSSSLSDGSRSHHNSSGLGSVCDGSNGNATAISVAGTTAESEKDEGLFSCDGIKAIDCHRSSQREAALNKFRLKRKDRCYEKKVSYV
eukprot:TRINITY_DN2860_c0_g4_i2.p1 TRINITY_DN2860_c0_g4~~TRINITY_DN2860_c0_g4_i2.p1  ORF type:complete len:648 (-),score=116.06 TRINITY_DN2860_c0_g4_i2:121-2064(-)